MNPRQLQRMMEQMGIKNREVKASRVVIECDGEDIVIDSPQVMEVEMQGQKSFQISGDVKQSPKAGEKEKKAGEDDVRLVAEQAGVGEDEARKALEECNGDIAEAIMKLKER